jgi:oxygen-independent coproporphyrinogen-3 oxidase
MTGPEAGQAKAGLAEQSALPPPLGLYVHVPFCASTCDFCAFYQEAPTRNDVARYLDGVRRELSQVSPERPVDTVFWGGGTPGLLSARDLRELGRIVHGACGGNPEEWTIELAPGSVTEERLEALREVGVTRVSLGVQSFQPELLEALGRRHSREQVLRAQQLVRAAGFASFNLDLMFALPGQADEAWEADLAEALALGPDHVSTYCLTFEEDTRLWVKLSRGQVRRDAEAEARLYEATWRRLESAGYPQYEVSNFARPGHACRHNVNTWRMGEWIGIGPSAASQHRGWRGANVADLSRWLEGLELGERMTEDRRAVTPALLAEDALVFGLRMNDGVALGPWRTRTPDLPWTSVMETLGALEEAGRLLSTDGVVRLTPAGRLVADAIGAEIISAFCPEVVVA